MKKLVLNAPLLVMLEWFSDCGGYGYMAYTCGDMAVWFSDFAVLRRMLYGCTIGGKSPIKMLIHKLMYTN